MNLVAKGNLASETAKASAGMKILAAEETKVRDIAKALGKTETEVKVAIKAQESAVKDVERAEAKRASEAMKALKAKEKLQKKLEKDEIAAIKGTSKIEAAKERAFKKELGDIRSLMKGDITPLFEGLGAKAALPVAMVTALGTAFVAAGVAATALLGTVGALALSAGKARDETKAMLDVLTGGRGTETMKLLDGLAKDLGVSITETREKFIEFRKAGLDNSQSVALLKLKADLESTGMSAGAAEEGIKKIIDQAKKADGSIDPKKFSEAFALIGKQAGVAGDGIAAATKNAQSLQGALNSLDNSKTQALEQIYDRIKPKIDEAAQKVATFVKAFLESDSGKAAIEAIGQAFDKLPGIIDAGIIFFKELWTQLQPLGPVLSETGAAIKEAFAAFGGGAGGASGAAAVLGNVIVGVVAAFALLIQTGAKVITAVATVGDNIKFLGGEIKMVFSDLASSAVSFGANIIQGLINGIKGAVGGLMSAVSGVASGVKNTFKSILGIASPSKEFKKLGMFTGKGLEIGLKQSVPDSAEIAGNMLPSPGSTPSSGGSSSSQSVTVGDIVVNVQGGSSSSAEDIAVAIRREIMMVLSGLNLSRGLP